MAEPLTVMQEYPPPRLTCWATWVFLALLSLGGLLGVGWPVPEALLLGLFIPTTFAGGIWIHFRLHGIGKTYRVHRDRLEIAEEGGPVQTILFAEIAAYRHRPLTIYTADLQEHLFQLEYPRQEEMEKVLASQWSELGLKPERKTPDVYTDRLAKQGAWTAVGLWFLILVMIYVGFRHDGTDLLDSFLFSLSISTALLAVIWFAGLRPSRRGEVYAFRDDHLEIVSPDSAPEKIPLTHIVNIDEHPVRIHTNDGCRHTLNVDILQGGELVKRLMERWKVACPERWQERDLARREHQFWWVFLLLPVFLLGLLLVWFGFHQMAGLLGAPQKILREENLKILKVLSLLMVVWGLAVWSYIRDERKRWQGKCATTKSGTPSGRPALELTSHTDSARSLHAASDRTPL